MRRKLVPLAMFTILISIASVRAQDETSRQRSIQATGPNGTGAVEEIARPRVAKVRGLDLARAVEETRGGYSTASPEVLARVREAYAQPPDESSTQERATFTTAPGPLLTGTWFVTVPFDETTVFRAYHTFGSDGTFVETSSLLGALAEGPSHGIWEARGKGALLTFELFAFDPNGNEAGRIRVRNLIRFTDKDHIAADSIVDFIDLNGDITEGIASSPFTAVRMKIRNQ